MTAGLVIGAAAAAPYALAREEAAPAAPIAAEPSGFLTVTDPIPGEYLVKLKGQASLAAQAHAQVADEAQSLARRHGAKPFAVYSAALRGFAVRLTEAQARKLAQDPAVQYVEQNGRVRLLDTQTNPPSWGLDRIDQRNLPLNSSYTYPTTASNVNVYVLDTGVYTAHSDFGGRARSALDTIRDGRNGQDCHGHGTHVAGTVAGARFGVAKGARIHSLRVLGCDGNGSYAGITEAIDWVTRNHQKPAVANMSLGGRGTNASMEAAVRNAVNAGVPFAIAAGNDNIDACQFTPAREPAAITVGATTSTDARSSFSNWGRCLDIFAPGSNIVSASHTNANGSLSMNGTSMASPHVAGVAALYLAANPNASAAQVRDALVNAGTPGKVTSPGSGSPNVLLHVASTGGPPTSPSPTPTSPSPSPTQTGDTTWAPYTYYAIGTRVLYDGRTYQCRQSHTAYPGWEPPNVLALWLPV
ncbi:MAG TPA: S8 family serine peptidase [Pilimelia sp.]|nr:S8 family serine peptidase [Pilimelia sp.]